LRIAFPAARGQFPNFYSHSVCGEQQSERNTKQSSKDEPNPRRKSIHQDTGGASYLDLKWISHNATFRPGIHFPFARWVYAE
jgi:hypothetical protein